MTVHTSMADSKKQKIGRQANPQWSMDDERLKRQMQVERQDPGEGLKSGETDTLGSYRDPQQEYPRSAFHRNAPL